MRVTLSAEGTYPHQFGGVSVWCDQLVRALHGYDFSVIALVATGAEPVQWELPPNVTGLATIPLWGSPPGGRRLGRGVPAPVRALIAGLCGGQDSGDLGQVLRELSEFAARHSLHAAAVRDVWEGPCG
jgi:polysaccharide biosynthesis protein PelF